MPLGFNGTRQIIDIPADGVVFLPIAATGPVRYIKVKESLLTAEGAANDPQGFTYKIPNDGSANGFTTAFPVAAPAGSAGGDQQATLELGDPLSLASKYGSPIGNGEDDLGAGAGTRAATVLFKARSATATATSIEVSQYY